QCGHCRYCHILLCS
nr:immunoglobulin heavy chain junction region [Mus musculus]